MKEFFESFRLAVGALLSRKGRSFLTILGIVIGVAGVIIIVALGAGAQSLVLSQITNLGTNLLGILPGKSNETGPPAAVFGVQVTTLTAADAAAIADKNRAPHVMAVAAFARGNVTAVWRDSSVDTNFSATQASFPRVQNVSVEQGRFFDEREERVGAPVIVLGSEVADELFGGSPAIGEVVKIKQLPFQVIGVMKKQGSIAFENQDDQVFIPLTVGQRQILGINHLQFIRLKVDDAANLQSTRGDVEQILREQHGILDSDNDDFSVRDLADAINVLTSITDGLRLFLVAMAGIALVVGGIGIMNIMLVTVAERTREIGLRKSLGATKGNIRNQFLFESGTVTLAGGFVGIIFGSLVSYAVALVARRLGYEWAFIISPLSIIMAVGVSILTGIVFGLYPAFKAAKLDPIEALRYE